MKPPMNNAMRPSLLGSIRDTDDQFICYMIHSISTLPTFKLDRYPGDGDASAIGAPSVATEDSRIDLLRQQITATGNRVNDRLEGG